MSDDCIFCKIARHEIPAQVISESDHWISFKDIGAKAPVHVLIIPKRHIRELNDLTHADAGLLSEMHLELIRIAKELNVNDSGYRIVCNCNNDGGQTVWHLHLHLLGGRSMEWPPG